MRPQDDVRVHQGLPYAIFVSLLLSCEGTLQRRGIRHWSSVGWRHLRSGVMCQ